MQSRSGHRVLRKQGAFIRSEDPMLLLNSDEAKMSSTKRLKVLAHEYRLPLAEIGTMFALSDNDNGHLRFISIKASDDLTQQSILD
jgi:hypothetical protein